MDVVKELREREAVRNPKGMEKAQTRAVAVGRWQCSTPTLFRL